MEEQVPHKRAFLVGGLGCSGKSTFAQRLAKERNLPYFRADDVYYIVANNLKLPADKMVYLPMESTWRDFKGIVNDFGVYGSMRECVKQAYLEYFSYNFPQEFVLEGEAIFWNGYERNLVNELLEGYEKINICLYPDYEQWLKNRTKRATEGGHLPTFKDLDQYNNDYSDLLGNFPERRIIIRDILNVDCSPTGGTNYQNDGFSDPKWPIFDFPKDMSGKKFLDISCNTGWFSKKAADAGAEVTGIDISWQVLADAQTRVPNGNFILSRVEDFEFGKYDYVLSSSAFHYYKDRENVIRKIAESTKCFVLETPLLNSQEEDIRYRDEFMESFCALVSEPLLLRWLKKHFKKVEKIGETVQPNSPNRSVYRCTQ